MIVMRLLLVLLVFVTFDLGGPLLAGAETVEELEEAAHGRRRLARLASTMVPPTAAVTNPARQVYAPPALRSPRRPVDLVRLPRKLPPRPASAPPDSPEDH
jgi:hypothetical protein